MASPTTDNIRVAIRVRPLIKRENDYHTQTHWKVDRNIITQISNGKALSNSPYVFDRIFDISNSTQDVYDEFGRPIVLSAMDGFNGTLFAYGQTSSGKTYTMMGDQQNEGVIPKAVGEIYDYIEKHPSREFLIRVSYMEIYNEDIKDLLNPGKTNLKIHENPQRQVYVGDLTEEVVSCPEDVFKHMFRGEKNRHFGETNMNDRSSRSHTIFRVIIESREMKDESKDPDTIDGAVRVAQLNLVDLAGSERASQTGAFGQRLKEGGHINKSLLALGSVIAKLSEGESFIPFRDSKLTRILQSSLGGNAKTSMICTITPAAVEETISTLKFASRAKTIKNCPEVNEDEPKACILRPYVLDDGTLLKRYRKEICELKKQLTEMSQQSAISQMQELQIEKEKMVEMLEQQRIQQSEQEEKIKRLRNMICSAGKENEPKPNRARLAKRRETWCPGAALSKAPLASAASLAVQSRLQRIGSSPSSDGSEFDEMPRETFFSRLDEEEERKSNEFSQRRVGFVSPKMKRVLSYQSHSGGRDGENTRNEPDVKVIEMQNEVKKLRKSLDEAVQTRDLYNELLEESNALLEKMSTENGFFPAPTNSDITLKYVAEMRNEKANLETQVEVLKTQCQDLEQLKVRNKELEEQVQSLENERTLSNEYLSELQAEYESAQVEKQALIARVEGLENAGTFNTAATVERDSLQMALEESARDKQQLQSSLEIWQEKYTSLEQEMTRLQSELAGAADCKDGEAVLNAAKAEVESLQNAIGESERAKQQLHENLDSWKKKFARLEKDAEKLSKELTLAAAEKIQLEEKVIFAKQETSEKTKELEGQLEQIAERISRADEQEQMLTDVIEQKLHLEEHVEFLKAQQEKEMSEQKLIIEARFEQLTTEKDNEIGKLLTEIENVHQLLTEKSRGVEEEKLTKEARFEQLKTEKDNEIGKLLTEIENVQQLLTEKSRGVEEKEAMLTQVFEEKRIVEERLNILKAEKDGEIDTLNSEIEGLRDEAANKLRFIEERETVLAEFEKQKCEAMERYDKLKSSHDDEVKDLNQELEKVRAEMREAMADVEEKENMLTDVNKWELESVKLEEIQKIKDRLNDLENELCERTRTLEEKENLLNEIMQLKSEAEEKFEVLKQEKETEIEQLKQELQKTVTRDDHCNQTLDSEDKQVMLLKANVSDLKVQLEKTIDEKKELEQMLDRVKKERDEIKNDLSESITDTAELQKDMFDMQQKVKRSKERIFELESELEKTAATIATLEEKNEKNTVTYQCDVELQRVKKESEELSKDLADERKAHDTLRKEHSSLSEELQHLRDSLLRDTNRGMDQQRVIEKMKAERRETICVQAHQRQELERDLCEAEKKVSELESQCTLLKSEKNVLEHRLEVANKKVEEIKQEMRDMENLYSSHNTRAVTQLDENKALQKLKQMEFSVDLTKQKCEKAEARVKELETENRQLRGADIRNGALSEERDNLKQQVHQTKQALDEKTKKLNELSIEITQLRAHIDKLSEENKKNRSLLEKKENKIDHLEQKLWDAEEELKLEKQRFQENQSKGQAIEELNSTIRVKLEELEHMTFLVDEKDIEIAEVRSSLQEHEVNQQQMAEKLQLKEERVDELENELEHASKNMLEARTGQQEAEAKIEELKAIIKQQESEIISMNETIESGKAQSEVQGKELSSKTLQLQNELQDMEHKLLEVESELEFTKDSCDKATADRKELVEILGAYGKILNESSVEDDNEAHLKFWKAQLEKNLEKISSLLTTANEVEDVRNKLKEVLDSRQSLEEKLEEIKNSFQEQKSALEEEIDELRESVLNEKKLVFELEDKVNFAENGKNAMEAELRRVLEEKETSELKDDGSINTAASEVTGELRHELETQKEVNAQLEEEARSLKEEITNWKNLSETNSMALEKVKRAMEEEMAGMTKRFEAEKQQLVDQLCEISSLKVKESEDMYSEKEEKIEELENQLATVTKTAADYKNALDHYQLKLAQVEYERDTTMERLEKQNSMNLVDSSEIETLRKECEMAKKKCKEAQEKYFSESDRLKAIIDEQEDEITELKAKVTKMAEASQNSTSLTHNSELESLRRECEVAKKKCKDAQEKYFSESDRLKAIIDEMQDEQEEYMRQIEELKEGTAKKEAELVEIKKAQAANTQNSRECEAEKKKAREVEKKYSCELDKLKAVIHEQRELIEKGPKEIEEEVEATRIDLAKRNMQIQSLQYDLYKLQEKYDNDVHALKKEVEWGREKVGSLKLEIRRLKEHEPEDTISLIRGQHVPAKNKENSDVGVVSNVAIYSLKAKVGKLEAETQRLNEKVQQLEKEKATLSLMNTESSNKVAQLTSENKALKTQKKKLMEEAQKLKTKESDTKLKGDSGRRLPEVSTETLERESRNASLLGLSAIENVNIGAAEHKRSKPASKKENFQNWLSEDSSNNIFKDEPNQCANQ